MLFFAASSASCCLFRASRLTRTLTVFFAWLAGRLGFRRRGRARLPAGFSRVRVTLAVTSCSPITTSRQFADANLAARACGCGRRCRCNRARLDPSDRWPRPAASNRSSRISASVPVVNIVTISSSSTPRPSMYHTRLPPCCGGLSCRRICRSSWTGVDLYPWRPIRSRVS